MTHSTVPAPPFVCHAAAILLVDTPRAVRSAARVRPQNARGSAAPSAAATQPPMLITLLLPFSSPRWTLMLIIPRCSACFIYMFAA